MKASLLGIDSALPLLHGTDGDLEFEPGGKTCWQRGFRLFATKKNDVIEEVSSKLGFGSLLAYEQVVTKPSG